MAYEGDLPTEGQVQGNVSLSDGGGQRSLKSDSVLLDRVKGLIRDGDLSVLEDGGDADGLPLDGDLNHRNITIRSLISLSYLIP